MTLGCPDGPLPARQPSRNGRVPPPHRESGSAGCLIARWGLDLCRITLACLQLSDMARFGARRSREGPEGNALLGREPAVANVAVRIKSAPRNVRVIQFDVRPWTSKRTLACAREILGASMRPPRRVVLQRQRCSRPGGQNEKYPTYPSPGDARAHPSSSARTAVRARNHCAHGRGRSASMAEGRDSKDRTTAAERSWAKVRASSATAHGPRTAVDGDRKGPRVEEDREVREATATSRVAVVWPESDDPRAFAGAAGPVGDAHKGG